MPSSWAEPPAASPDGPWWWRRAEWLLLAFVLACHVGRYVQWNPADFRHGGDGFYIYLLARSVAFDGDLDLTNDYALCGDPWHLAIPTAIGRPANPYYIGPTTVWAPALWILRHVMRFSPGAAEATVGGCQGRLPYLVGLLGPAFVTLTVFLGMRLARRFASRGAALVGGLVVAFGSSLVVFGSLWWNYTHVWAACALTTAVLAFARLHDAPERLGRWIACGLAIGWATLMRPHHVAWLLAPGLLTVMSMVATARGRMVPWREALRGLAALAAFFAAFSIRLVSNHAIYGLAWPPVTGAVYLQPWHAHPLLMLFSGQAGLLYQTPMMWFAVVGAFLVLRPIETRRLAWLIFLPFLLDFWMCACPLDWAGGATVGPRLLTSFTGLFVAWSAVSFDRIAAFVRREPRRYAAFAAAGWLLPALLVSWKLVWGVPTPTTPVIYGRGVQSLLEESYELIGNPSTLPATMFFAARYGTKPSNFDRVARYAIFRHDFLTGRLEYGDTLSFHQLPDEVVVAAGMRTTPTGGYVNGGRTARLVFPLAWPFVTRLRFRYQRPSWSHATAIHVRSGSFFRRFELGRVPLARGAGEVEVRCPPGALDSGINELLIDADGPLVITSMQFVDDTSRDTQSVLDRLRRPVPPPRP